jgi:EAL domain
VRARLEAIVAMAQRLGLDIIPEGIEDLDQLARLRVMGCHIGQGFLLSRPVSTEAIDALLAAPTPLPHIGLSGAVTRPILTSATWSHFPRHDSDGRIAHRPATPPEPITEWPKIN